MFSLQMRAVLVDWLVEVQVQLKLLQETLLSAISIVDRFLAVEGRSVTRSKLQLVGVAAMFLASKVEEVFAPACSCTAGQRGHSDPLGGEHNHLGAA